MRSKYVIHQVITTTNEKLFTSLYPFTAVPLYPVGNISRTASAAGLELEWQPLNMSCVGTKRTFEEVLREVKQWLVLPENSQEIVVLFLDTKFRLTPEQVFG